MTEHTFTAKGDYDSFIGGNANCSYIVAPESIDDLGAFIEYITDINKSDSIIGIIPLLRDFTTAEEVNVPAGVAQEVGTNKVYILSDNGGAMYSVSLYSNFTTLDGYTPHNNKLYTYPYNYMSVVSSNGSNAIIEYEKITANNNFLVSYSATMSPTLTLTPHNYNGVTNCLDKCVSFSQFAPIAYSIDTYNAWYAQNKNVVDLTLYEKAGAIVKAGAGALNAQSFSQANGAAENVAAQTGSAIQWLASLKDMQRRPDELRGTLNGNAMLYMEKGGIQALDMCVKAEYAELIDRYFDMYGYNVSITKTPQINSRAHYNYCKTIGSNIYGTIAEDQKEKIDTLFNDGITVWHISNGAIYGQYDTQNLIP